MYTPFQSNLRMPDWGFFRFFGEKFNSWGKFGESLGKFLGKKLSLQSINLSILQR